MNKSVEVQVEMDGDTSYQPVGGGDDNNGGAVDGAEARQAVASPEKIDKNNGSTTSHFKGDSPMRTDESETHHLNFGGAQRLVSDLPESCHGTNSDRVKRFQEQENHVRKNAKHSIVWLAVVNGYSALLVFVIHLISLESMLSIAFSVGLTIYTYDKTKDNPSFDGSALDYVLLSFAVITPMTTSIGMAFTRRDRALKHLVVMRSTMVELYAAHASWDWKKVGQPGTGRASSDTNWLDHSDAALVEILGICHVLSRFLTLPTATRARHRITSQGRGEADETLALASKLYGCMLVRFGRLTDLCEVLKAEGLPPNEATRIRQWERMVLEQADGLRTIKIYRTPQALRSFARIFTVILPPFYAPSYAEIAASLNSLAVGIIFSVLTSLALTALFETISQMEDPFQMHTSLDGIDVDSELSSSFVVQCMTMRSHFFRNAGPFDEDCVATTICERLPVKTFTMVSSVSKHKGGRKEK